MIFDLTGKVAVITGAAGTMGKMHAQAIEHAGGIAIKTDIVKAFLNIFPLHYYVIFYHLFLIA